MPARNDARERFLAEMDAVIPWARQAEDSLYDSESMRRFARIEFGEDVVPDETTILRFRHLLEERHLNTAMFEAIAGLPTEKRLLPKAGTIGMRRSSRRRARTKNAAATRTRRWSRGGRARRGTSG